MSTQTKESELFQRLKNRIASLKSKITILREELKGEEVRTETSDTFVLNTSKKTIIEPKNEVQGFGNSSNLEKDKFSIGIIGTNLK